MKITSKEYAQFSLALASARVFLNNALQDASNDLSRARYDMYTEWAKDLDKAEELLVKSEVD